MIVAISLQSSGVFTAVELILIQFHIYISEENVPLKQQIDKEKLGLSQAYHSFSTHLRVLCLPLCLLRSKSPLGLQHYILSGKEKHSKPKHICLGNGGFLGAVCFQATALTCLGAVQSQEMFTQK